MEENEDQKENQKEKVEKTEREDEDEIQRKNFEKYKIDYLSFKTSMPETSLKTLCPICSNVPDINLSLDSEKGHYVKCPNCRYCYCCSHPRSKTLEDYILIQIKIQQDDTKCEIHKEKGLEEEAFFSCEKCQKWMCEECINEHIKNEENKDHHYYIIRKVSKDYTRNTICPEHDLEYTYYVNEDFFLGYHICDKCEVDEDDPDTDIIYIEKQKGECYFNQLKKIIKKGVEYLDVYCNNIYENLMKSIKNEPDLIKKAKEIYDKFLIRNRRALFYFQMLINTGTPSIANYNLIRNISNAILTKFEKINIKLSDKLTKEEIDKILYFFATNYIVGTHEENLEEIKDMINIKELATLKKEEEKIEQELNKEEENGDKKIKFIDIIVLNNKIIVGGDEKGYVHLFELDNLNSNGKFILSKKVHEKELIALDNLKNTKNKFVTCDEKEIKIWTLKQTDNNNYNFDCETTLKDFSESKLTHLYVLNSSNSISFINNDNQVFILDMFYKPFFKCKYKTRALTALYQIESNDENNSILIIGGKSLIILYKNLDNAENIQCLGSVRIEAFSGKSIFYLGNDLLLVGGNSNIYIANIKTIKLEQIIRISSAECSCFLKYNDMVLCGYGDTSSCHSWSYGIAQEKTTKFMVIKKNEENYENHFIEEDFYNFGITNAIWLDNDKFISCFYNNDCLKIFQVK